VQSLIEKTEREGDKVEETVQNQTSAFSFAKIWAADKDSLTEMNETASDHGDEVDDSWAQVLAKLEVERSKVRTQEVTGRGAKRKAAPSFLPEVGDYFLWFLLRAYWHHSDRQTPLDGMARTPRTARKHPRKRRGRGNFWIAKTIAPPFTLLTPKARAELTPAQWPLMTSWRT
jgi:hypothetical protein